MHQQSTLNPSTIHVISACTLATLYTIPSVSLISFAYPTPASPTTAKPNDVLSSLDIDTPHASARPIYALSNRLLAYVSPISLSPGVPPPPTATRGHGQAHTSTPVPPPENQVKLGLNMTQAELGNAAAKLGGSVLSGMPTLGGMAISAACAGVAAAVAEQNTATGPGTGFGSMFFSKSTPAATGSPHEYQTTQYRRRCSLRVSPPANRIFGPHTGAPVG